MSSSFLNKIFEGYYNYFASVWEHRNTAPFTKEPPIFIFHLPKVRTFRVPARSITGDIPIIVRDDE